MDQSSGHQYTVDCGAAFTAPPLDPVLGRCKNITEINLWKETSLWKVQLHYIFWRKLVCFIRENIDYFQSHRASQHICKRIYPQGLLPNIPKCHWRTGAPGSGAGKHQPTVVYSWILPPRPRPVLSYSSRLIHEPLVTNFIRVDKTGVVVGLSIDLILNQTYWAVRNILSREYYIL